MKIRAVPGGQAMKYLFGLVALTMAVLAASAQGVGAVQGRVLNADNQPVAHVKVYPLPEHAAYIGQTPAARTDDQGNFELQGLMPGEHKLFVVYPEGGYPDGSAGIFAGDPSLYTVVDVVSGQTLKNISLRLPPKGALFRAHIIDAVTGKPVLSARIRVTRPDLAKDFYESGPNLKGDFEIVLTQRAFRIEIHAPDTKRGPIPEQIARVDRVRIFFWIRAARRKSPLICKRKQRQRSKGMISKHNGGTGWIPILLRLVILNSLHAPLPGGDWTTSPIQESSPRTSLPRSNSALHRAPKKLRSGSR
jgi:hypothetical protein